MSQRLDSQESIILDPRGNNKLQNEPATGFQEELSNSKTPEYQRVPESQEELGLLRGFQSQLRGPCSKCGGGVYTHQLRGRDDNGMYFHAEPQHCAQAPTRRRDEEKTASAAVSEEAWMRQQDTHHPQHRDQIVMLHHEVHAYIGLHRETMHHHHLEAL